MRKILLVAVTLCFFNAAGAGQVPIQDRQPAGSALRPAVMGPTGGVSTGHPLTTAAAFSILLKGGNAFDAGVASLIAGGVLGRTRRGGEALVVYPKRKQVSWGWAPKAVVRYLNKKTSTARA
jgi:gamma-glutamyltranspeptidase/glutathione hydrolase